MTSPKIARPAFRALVGPLLIAAVFLAALWLLHNQLQQFQLSDLVDSLANIPARNFWLAVALTGLNYLILMGYDVLGIMYVGHSLHLGKVAFGSFLGHAVGNNFGTLLGGSAIRYRLYSSWGLSAVQVVKLVILLGITFWIGLFALAGVLFLWRPLPIPPELHFPASTTRPLGALLGSLALLYLGLCIARRQPIRIGSWEFVPPPPGLSLMQFGVAAIDLTVAAGVLYVLLPSSVPADFLHVLGIYLLAIIAALVTQVPGGLGVLELVVVVLLRPPEPHAVVGSLLAFRVIYYLVPLAVGLVALATHELILNRSHAQRTVKLLRQWVPMVVPRLLAFSVFVAGTILLMSGAMPAASGRMPTIRSLLPLPVVEVSHFLGSVIGVWLLILARGLWRKIETAYYLTVALLAAGILTSVFKGFDYEEASILAGMLAIFLPTRRHFYRKGALLTERFTFRWTIALLLVFTCTVWLMRFAYRHVEYSDDLWWQFALDAHAPRSLRAMMGAVLGALVALSVRLLRPRAAPADFPTSAEMAIASEIVTSSTRTYSQLALLGDKRFLISDDRTALIMYGIQGNSYVALGDPIGRQEALVELAWSFYELCDMGGHWPVFYQASEDFVSLYVEMGLSLIKIGEEARVPLVTFGLEGHDRKALRRTSNQLTEQGYTFELVEPPAVAELVPSLRAISDAWLAEKNVAEKGFSMGSFQPDYIARGPVAIIQRRGNVVAFANVWTGAQRQELSVDLMRYLPGSHSSVMEFLFIQLMLWGKDAGYQAFNLGMAPLAGIDAPHPGPMWNQLAALAYRHGDHFYNFQGLRQYKDKFDPVWSPKYLASPGGWALPVILTNVATLISGSVRRLVVR